MHKEIQSQRTKAKTELKNNKRETRKGQSVAMPHL